MEATEYNFNEFKKLSEENERLTLENQFHRKNESDMVKALAERVDALTKENERLKGGSIENPDHHIKVLKEQISRMEDEYKALTKENEEMMDTITKQDVRRGNDFSELSKLHKEYTDLAIKFEDKNFELSRLREERKEYHDVLKEMYDEMKNLDVQTAPFFQVKMSTLYVRLFKQAKSLLDKFNDSKL